MSGEGERRPGGNPELKALLQELRPDGDAGDPFFPKGAPDAAKGAAPAAATGAAAASATGPAAVTAPAAATAAAVVTAKPRGKRSLGPLWLSLGVLCIVAPLVALGLAALLRRPVVQVQVGPSPAPQPATVYVPASGQPVTNEADAGVAASEDGGVEDGGAEAEAGAVSPRRAEAPSRAGDVKAEEGDAGTAPPPPRPEQGTDIW